VVEVVGGHAKLAEMRMRVAAAADKLHWEKIPADCLQMLPPLLSILRKSLHYQWQF